MRINQYVAHATGLSRRAADQAVTAGRVEVDGAVATLGSIVAPQTTVLFDGKQLHLPAYQTIMLNKPTGYVTSRRQQGNSPTVYELLPAELAALKPIGRLDKDSSGVLLLTNDGELAQRLQHPSQGKWKCYEVRLNRALAASDRTQLEDGVGLDDGISRMHLDGSGQNVVVRLQEGRNRQIRRSFEAVGYRVVGLHRTDFGSLALGNLAAGTWRVLTGDEIA